MGLLSKLLGTREPEDMPVHVDDSNFGDEVLKSELPVLLDIWGPGCAPCKRLEPIMFDLHKKYRGRVKVAEINAAAAPSAMAQLEVRGTPTVIAFRKGQEVERVVGFRGSIYFEEVIAAQLLPPA